MVEFIVACEGYDWHDLGDKNQWRTLFSSSSSRTSRAYDAIEEKRFATNKRIDTDNCVYDDVYENEGTGFAISTYQGE